MNLEGRITRLRAVEPGDIDRMYAWENDTSVWRVSGTTAPFSRNQLERFVSAQQTSDIFRSGQLRLIIETSDNSTPIGTLDLFEFDPLNLRAGIGILVYDPAQRGQGYASDAVETLCRYCRDTLRMHQLWCSITADNEASLRLFRQAGFLETGVRRDWTWQGDHYADEIVFQKILQASIP